jgi:hypothetical protein
MFGVHAVSNGKHATHFLRVETTPSLESFRFPHSKWGAAVGSGRLSVT